MACRANSLPSSCSSQTQGIRALVAEDVTRLPVSKAGILLRLTNDAPASCHHSSFCELFSALERVATEREIHHCTQSTQGSNWSDEQCRVIVWRAGEPGLSTLDKWRNGMIAPSKLGEHSKGEIRGPAKKEQPAQHLIVVLARTICIEMECTDNFKAEIRRVRNLWISLIGKSTLGHIDLVV